MDNFINLVEWRVVKLVVSVNVFFVLKSPVVLIFVRLDVAPDVVLFILNYLARGLLLYFCLFGFLLLSASDFDTLITKEDKCLNNVAIVVLDGLRHVCVDNQRAQSENESLHFEVLLDGLDLGHHGFEQFASLLSFFELCQGDTEIIPEAHQDSLD